MLMAHRTEYTSREFLSTAIWTMPSLSLHFSKMASWMARSQFSPTSLRTHKCAGYEQNLISLIREETTFGSSWQLITQAAWIGTHMTGSNMFLIFRHGVRLLGGEFLRSRGKAEKDKRQNQNIHSWFSAVQ